MVFSAFKVPGRCSLSMGDNLQMLTGIDDTSVWSTWLSGIRPVTKWSLVQVHQTENDYWYMLGVNLVRTGVPSRGSQ